MVKNFEIGQIVYIVPDKAQHILPGMVVEELTVRKITGNTTTWKIKVGSEDKAKVIDSDKFNGEVYGSLELVQTAISNQLNEYLAKITTDAENLVEKWYGKDIAEKQKNLPRLTNVSLDGDSDLLLSSLDGGSSISESSSSSTSTITQNMSGSNRQRPPSSKMEAKDRLRDMLVDEEEDLKFVQQANGSIEQDTKVVYVTQPDGQKVLVSIPKI